MKRKSRIQIETPKLPRDRQHQMEQRAIETSFNLHLKYSNKLWMKKNYVRKLTTTFNSQIKTMASFAPILKIVIFVLLDVWVPLYVKCRIFINFLLLSVNYERLITVSLNEVYFFSRRFRIRQNMHLVRVYWSRKYKCTTPSLLKLRYIAVL